MSRRISRILAFQALYSWAVGGVDIKDLVSFSWIERDSFEDATTSVPCDIEIKIDSENENELRDKMLVPTSDIRYFLNDSQFSAFEEFSDEKKNEIFTFANLLVTGTIENINQIDALIKNHLSSKWSIERINKVALNVIRIGVYELLYHKEVSPSVVIDEAVEIVKNYGTDDSHKFTNAILDNIKKDI